MPGEPSSNVDALALAVARALAPLMQTLIAATIAELAPHLTRGDEALLDKRAAAALGVVSARGFLDAIGRGELSAVKDGRGRFLVKRADLMAWVSARRVVAAPTVAPAKKASKLDEEYSRIAGGAR